MGGQEDQWGVVRENVVVWDGGRLLEFVLSSFLSRPVG